MNNYKTKRTRCRNIYKMLKTIFSKFSKKTILKLWINSTSLLSVWNRKETNYYPGKNNCSINFTLDSNPKNNLLLTHINMNKRSLYTSRKSPCSNRESSLLKQKSTGYKNSTLNSTPSSLYLPTKTTNSAVCKTLSWPDTLKTSKHWDSK